MKHLIGKLVKVAIVFTRFYVYLFYCTLRRVNHSQVWLISERGTDARDNSLHLFEYIRKNHPNVDIKYVISSSSADYQKVKQLGDVIEYGSPEHYIYLISAGVLISTHIMGYSPDMSLFWRLDKYNLLRLRGKRVFLQHGITKDYIPMMTAGVAKLDLFICGARPEYEYVVKEYGFAPGVVKYTGFPRFDNLVSIKNRQILLMPTFRKWLNYVENFKETEYYERYNNILNSEKLNNLLEEYNYKLVFYPHFEIQKRLKDFHIRNNKNIIIADLKNYDVQALLSSSDLLITDYSSVFFDFGYMRKPIVYYQFDISRYRYGHYSEGYFSYESNGFGPVVYDENKIIEYIENQLKNGMVVSRKYKERMKDFFQINDRNNSARVYLEITSLLTDISTDGHVEIEGAGIKG